MELLALRLDTRSDAGIGWLTLRRLAMRPPPEVPGLRARTYSARRKAVFARFLFEDSATLESFRATPAQVAGAFDPLPADGVITEQVDSVPSTVTAAVFDRPVFILSAPRSGSTLLYETLSRSDQLDTIDGEIQGIIDGIPALHLAARNYRSQVLEDSDADAETITTLRAGLLAEIGGGNSRFTMDWAGGGAQRVRLLEKTPENALRIPFLRRAFPDARYIFLYRDMRQNISSMVEAWRHVNFTSIPDLPGWSRKRWNFLLPEGWRRYNESSLTEVAAFQWREANHSIVHELEAMHEDQWTTTTYEDLVAAPAMEIERLCEFIGIPFEGKLARSLDRPLPLSSTTLTPPSPIKWKSNRDFDAAVVRGLQPLAGRMRSLRVNTAPPVRRESFRARYTFRLFR